MSDREFCAFLGRAFGLAIGFGVAWLVVPWAALGRAVRRQR
jgi:hypothetical protein